MKLFVNRSLSKDMKCWEGRVSPYLFPTLRIYNELDTKIKANEAINCDIRCVKSSYPPISEISIIYENKKSDDIIGLFLIDSSNSYGYRMLARPDDALDLLIKYKSYRVFCDSIWVANSSNKFLCSKFGVYRLGACIVTQEKGLKYWELTESGWKSTKTKPSKYNNYILMDDNLVSVARQLNNELVEDDVRLFLDMNMEADFIVLN